MEHDFVANPEFWDDEDNHCSRCQIHEHEDSAELPCPEYVTGHYWVKTDDYFRCNNCNDVLRAGFTPNYQCRHGRCPRCEALGFRHVQPCRTCHWQAPQSNAGLFKHACTKCQCETFTMNTTDKRTYNIMCSRCGVLICQLQLTKGNLIMEADKFRTEDVKRRIKT